MLSQADIDQFRERLRELMNRHDSDLSGVQDEALRALGGEAGGGISNLPAHLADMGNATYEEEVGLGLMENEERLLAECTAALARIEAGTYGLCEGCYQPIPKRRLLAFPYARRCVSCARKQEQNGT
jgi:DnaK suppressor protein